MVDLAKIPTCPRCRAIAIGPTADRYFVCAKCNWVGHEDKLVPGPPCRQTWKLRRDDYFGATGSWRYSTTERGNIKLALRAAKEIIDETLGVKTADDECLLLIAKADVSILAKTGEIADYLMANPQGDGPATLCGYRVIAHPRRLCPCLVWPASPNWIMEVQFRDAMEKNVSGRLKARSGPSTGG